MFALVPFALAAFFGYLSISAGIPFLLLVAAFFAVIGGLFAWLEFPAKEEELTQISRLDREEV